MTTNTSTETVTASESASSGIRINARVISFVILFFAILVSSYLSYLKFDAKPAVCLEGGHFDCGVVLNSAYSELGGIPIAYLGLATNLIVLALLLLEPRFSFFKENGTAMVFGVVLFAFMFSVYLVYVQAMIIESYCPWCLTHEALITLLFIVSTWRLYRWYAD